MKKTIFLSKDYFLDSKQEIEFLNYLVGQTYDTFFKNITTVKQQDKLKAEYQKVLTDSNCVLIPLLKYKNYDFAFLERYLLGNPAKLLKQPTEVLEKYFYVYQVAEATLTILDKEVSTLFSLDFKKASKLKQDFTILDSTERLVQYKDIVFGIASNKVNYYRDVNFVDYMQKELITLYKQEKIFRKLLMYYIVGTTAISLKGCSKKLF